MGNFGQKSHRTPRLNGLKAAFAVMTTLAALAGFPPEAAAQGVACCDVVTRGLAFAEGRVYFNTLDGYTHALDANDGRLVWRVKVADIRRGETLTMAPLVAKGKVLIGNSGGEYGVRGWLAALDAFHDSPINLTICRQEGGATMMADASARLTGRPGIVFVTRGPGATNAAAGLHIAEHDSSPLIMFIGQVQREASGRGAFQEIDYRKTFGGMAKGMALA